MESSEELEAGDYVLATKWSDGDSQDHWFVGFFVEKEGDRYIVSDVNGVSARHSGFRRCKKIHPAIGEYLIKNNQAISSIRLNLWEYVASSVHEIVVENWDYEHGALIDNGTK